MANVDNDASSLEEIKKEWKGVNYTKLPIDGAISIGYSERFRVLCGIMYSAMRREETSSRALRLTGQVIAISPRDYTAYEYRRAILRALGGEEMIKELKWATDCCLDNLKNYQVWQHRRWVVEQVGNIEDEIIFVQAVLLADSKNYHAWSHRMWAVKHFYEKNEYNDEDAEVDFTEKFLENDPRNNSVWSYRYFIFNLFEMGGIGAEVAFALTHMRRAPRNESVWNYVRALLRLQPDDGELSVGVKAAAQQILDEDPGNIPARMTLMHLLRATIMTGNQAAQQEAVMHANFLGDKYDPIRRAYWKWCATQFEEL